MPSLRIALEAVVTFIALTSAIPLHNFSSFDAFSARHRPVKKRTPPIIGEGIDINDPVRGGKLIPRNGLATSGAFAEAQELLSHSLFTESTTLHSYVCIYGEAITNTNILKLAFVTIRAQYSVTTSTKRTATE